MKNSLLFLTLFMSFRLLGQEAKNVFDDTFSDFTKTDADPSKIKKIDTILQFFSVYNRKTDVEIVLGNRLISSRRYFLNSKIIKQEFMRINKFRYHCLENDSLNDNKLIAKGDFIVSLNPFLSIDTIAMINPITYETVEQIQKLPTLLKDGEWFESDSIFLYQGNYKYGKREGKWTKHRRMDGIDEAELIYENGTLISSELNLVLKSDTNAIKALLIGKWCVTKRDHKSDTIVLTKADCDSRFYFKFSKNGVFEYINEKSSTPQNESFDNWKINRQFELEYGDYRTGKIRHSKLISVRQNVIKLRGI